MEEGEGGVDQTLVEARRLRCVFAAFTAAAQHRGQARDQESPGGAEGACLAWGLGAEQATGGGIGGDDVEDLRG